MVWTVFEYLYRDADNYKSFGSVAFKGSASAELWDSALSALDDGTYFIAEQIGLPPLYDQLYRWSGGVSTGADHCWHEFVSLVAMDESELPALVPKMGEAIAFADRLLAVDGWDILSLAIESGFPIYRA